MAFVTRYHYINNVVDIYHLSLTIYDLYINLSYLVVNKTIQTINIFSNNNINNHLNNY